MTPAANAVILQAMATSGNIGGLLDPWGDEWAADSFTSVPLAPTPLDRQPSAYVQAAWADRPYGGIDQVRLSSRVAGNHLAIALWWDAPEASDRISDNDVYADACGVLFPLNGHDAELSTMGDDAQPVTAWHWRAGTSEPFVVLAHGLGTVERQDNRAVRAAAEWRSGAWRIVFARPLDAAGVPLGPGASIPFGVAIWTGANQERAGLKAHTPTWHRLQLP